MNNKIKSYTEYLSEYEILSIENISLTQPNITNEAIILNASLDGKEVKRGDEIWITAIVKKNSWNLSSTVVLKTRIIDIYNNLSILNNLK